MFKLVDLLWIAASPLYLVIGTARHEGSHALVALMEGAKVAKFVFWPTEHGWGYVVFSGPVSWLTGAAPYFCDLATFLLFLWPCLVLSGRRRGLWINCLAVGLISPVVNSIYNYSDGLRGVGDVGRVLGVVPSWTVHTYFATMFVAFAVGFALVLTRSCISAGVREHGLVQRKRRPAA